jgi:hypothetical protein
MLETKEKHTFIIIISSSKEDEILMYQIMDEVTLTIFLVIFKKTRYLLT